MRTGLVSAFLIENLVLDELSREGSCEFLFVFTPVRPLATR